MILYFIVICLTVLLIETIGQPCNLNSNCNDAVCDEWIPCFKRGGCIYVNYSNVKCTDGCDPTSLSAFLNVTVQNPANFFVAEDINGNNVSVYPIDTTASTGSNGGCGSTVTFTCKDLKVGTNDHKAVWQPSPGLWTSCLSSSIIQQGYCNISDLDDQRSTFNIDQQSSWCTSPPVFIATPPPAYVQPWGRCALGTVAYATCNTTYYSAAGTLVTPVTCIANGTWSPKYPCLGCETFDSSRTGIESVANLTVWQNSSVFGVNTTINITCEEGYYTTHLRSDVATCNENGWSIWDPCESGCSINISSLTRKHITNADNITAVPYYSNLTTGNEIRYYQNSTNVTFTCDNQSYTADGNASTFISQCAKNHWVERLWNACRIGCPNPQIGKLTYESGDLPILNRNVYVQYAVVTFKCLGDFYGNDANLTVTCQTNGTWDKTFPTCLPGCTTLNIPNGTVAYVNSTAVNTNLYMINSTAVVKCNRGYAFITPNRTVMSAVSTCENGKWTPVEPCLRVCGPAPEIANMESITYLIDNVADKINMSFPNDTTTTYTCKFPNRIGSDYAKSYKCDSGVWTGPEPICSFGLFITKTAMTMSCSILIGSLIFIIFLTLLLRDFSVESVIHLNEEISLLLAHLILLTARERVDLVTICNVAGIGLQYFFTVNFLFMVIEGLQCLSILQNVISFGGFWQQPRLVYTVLGWFLPMISTGITTAVYFDSYPSSFSCWVNCGSDIAVAIIGPMIICVLLTVILTEAAVLESFSALPLCNKNQRIAAHVNQKALFPFVFLCSLSCFVGMVGAYRLDLYLFSIVSVANTSLAFCFVVFHFVGNPKLINWFRNRVVKKIKAKWNRQ